MQFTFLGTSAGIPTLQRNVSGLALSVDEQRDWYLVDCGEGTQHRMLQAGLSSARLRTIFITHVHGDHCYGLPGLLASSNMVNRSEPLTVCAPEGIEEYIKAVFHYTDVNMRYPLQFIRSDMPGFTYEDKAIRVESIELSHRVPSFAYRFEECPSYYELDKEKLLAANITAGPEWGELQRGNTITLSDGRIIAPEDICQSPQKKRAIIVGGDNDRPELLHDAMLRSDVLIHEATFTEDVLEKIGPKYKHSTAGAVAKAAAQAKIPNLVLTHISQRYSENTSKPENQLATLHNEADACYQGNLFMAEDFASYHLKRDGLLAVSKKYRANHKNPSV